MRSCFGSDEPHRIRAGLDAQNSDYLTQTKAR